MTTTTTGSVQAMTELSEPPLTLSETRRRLPTLQCIDDVDLRSDVTRASAFAPAYFWTRAGSTAGYHNAHEHGLWAHTLKLSTVIDRLADTWVEQGLMREEDVDRAHAAAILHDQRKEGESAGETQSDHDLQMGAVAREKINDEVVARCVEAHMGAWYDGPFPQSTVELLVHIADMVASGQALDAAVAEPVPVELEPHVSGGVEL